MTRILLCFGLLSVSFALDAMDKRADRSVSCTIEYAKRQKENVNQTYRKTFEPEWKKVVTDKILDSVVKSDCFNEVTNRELIDGGQERVRFGGVKRPTYDPEMNEFGALYGKKMREYNGNFLQAFPSAVEEHCFDTHNTPVIRMEAIAIADQKARQVTSQNLKNVIFPRDAMIGIGNNETFNDEPRLGTTGTKSIKLDTIGWTRISTE